MPNPNYLIQDVTGRIYPYTAAIAIRPDLKPYEMPIAVKEVKKEVKKEIEKLQDILADAPDFAAAEERIEKIKAAIKTIPLESYGKPRMGLPAMPKVADVSEAAGFRVTVDEVAAAFK